MFSPSPVWKLFATLTVGTAIGLAGAATAIAKERETPSMPMAVAPLKGPNGEDRGQVKLTEGPNGLLAEIMASGLTPGWHAIHVHETGGCAKSDFTDAGSHAAPEHHQHGFLVEGGMHSGDMPNVWAMKDGVVEAQHFLKGVTLDGQNGLLDKDGAAVIIHAKPDDYLSQPSGDAGDRVACGTVTLKN